MLDYVERTYIGKIKKDRNERNVARFPISCWNLYLRVMGKISRTNNNAETWHGQISNVTKKNMSCGQLIVLLKDEQGLTETTITQLKTGEVNGPKNSTAKKDVKIFRIVSQFDKEDIFEYLKNVGLILDEDRIARLEKKHKRNAK